MLQGFAVIATDLVLVARHANYPERLFALVAVVLLGQAVLGAPPPSLALGPVKPALVHTGRVALTVTAVGLVLAFLLLLLARPLALELPKRPANVSGPELVVPWLIVACLQAPIVEELLYRATLLPALLLVLPRWPAFLICGFLFWAYHWISWGGITPANQLFAGVLLSWSYDRTRGLLAPILLHALGNLFVLGVDLALLTWPDRIAHWIP